jgi:hypothetical protein
MQLLEADSRLANAQDARKRGMFDMASREAQNAQNRRLEAFKLEQDSKSATAGLLANVAATRAGMPLQEAQIYGTQIQSAVSVHQAFKENLPEAVKVWKFSQSNPEFAKFLKTQEDVKTFHEQMNLQEKQFEKDLDTRIKAGEDVSEMLKNKDKIIRQKVMDFLNNQQVLRSQTVGVVPSPNR